MYKFCEKCGNITWGNKLLEEKCWVCGNIKIPVPTKYIQENEILTDKEITSRTVALMEELVKTSPEFDQYLFEHRDEILARQSAEFNAKMAHGKAILEGKSRRVTCPYCSSTRVSRISILGRMVSVEFWGLASNKLGKQWHCDDCGSNF